MIGGMQGHMNGDAAYHRCNQNCNQGRECDCVKDDLVKRLRDAAALPTGLYAEAADEIERLRKQRDELVLALFHLSRSCDTGERNTDGSQRGIKTPDRFAIEQARATLAKIEGEGK